MKTEVDSRFLSSIGDYYRSLSPQLWSVIDEEINIKESEIFRYSSTRGLLEGSDRCFSSSYRPDGTSDPFSEGGTIWSINFFLYNRKLRRILFLTCRADCKSSSSHDDENDEEPLEYNQYLSFEG